MTHFPAVAAAALGLFLPWVLAVDTPLVEPQTAPAYAPPSGTRVVRLEVAVDLIDQQPRNHSSQLGHQRRSHHDSVEWTCGIEFEVPDASHILKGEHRLLGVRVSGVRLDGERVDDRLAFDEGFHGAEPPALKDDEELARWSSAAAVSRLSAAARSSRSAWRAAAC